MFISWTQNYNNNIHIQQVLINDVKKCETYETSMYSIDLIHFISTITEHVMIVENPVDSFSYIYSELYDDYKHSHKIQQNILDIRDFLYTNNIIYKKHSYLCTIYIAQIITPFFSFFGSFFGNIFTNF